MSIEIGFTGTRRVMTLAQHTNLTAELTQLRTRTRTMVNGCCEGSDRIAWSIWRELDGRFRFRPGDRDQWKWALQVYRGDRDDLFVPVGYMQRNDVIAQSPIVLATPGENLEVARSGTWATIRRARRSGADLTILLPNGEIVMEARS